mmetsp:Transcript_367/g.598  ORF Transcript_367/g.598 Transcript_367/m.598 type:complete len:387 (-) Transcript_367:758-1918(-)
MADEGSTLPGITQAATDNEQASHSPQAGAQTGSEAGLGDELPPEAGEGTEGADEGAEPISKKRQKKMAKLERIHAYKGQRRLDDKAKKEVKKQARSAAFHTLPAEEQELAKKNSAEERQARRTEHNAKQIRMKQAVSEGSQSQKLVIDLDFEGLMPETDERHLCQQISYSYSANSKVLQPCHMHLLGLKGNLKTMAEKSISGIVNWHVTRSESGWQQVFADQLDKVVYLTADSENELDDLDSSKIYIIGGIVDHNRYKSLCLNRATAAGVATARLPITKHVQLETSAVLAVNHVVQIMVEYMNKRDWAAVLDEVLPKRKRADFKSGKEEKASGKRPQLHAQPEQAMAPTLQPISDPKLDPVTEPKSEPMLEPLTEPKLESVIGVRG